jgi:hypothetical protein
MSRKIKRKRRRKIKKKKNYKVIINEKIKTIEKCKHANMRKINIHIFDATNVEKISGKAIA